jgi:hypothetical protein
VDRGSDGEDGKLGSLLGWWKGAFGGGDQHGRVDQVLTKSDLYSKRTRSSNKVEDDRLGCTTTLEWLWTAKTMVAQ